MTAARGGVGVSPWLLPPAHVLHALRLRYMLHGMRSWRLRESDLCGEPMPEGWLYDGMVS